MTRKLEIEAKLDRSLANQVKAPQLDRRFDAAVWARIEAAGELASGVESQLARPRSPARWLRAINAFGVAVTALLVLKFGSQWFADLPVSVPFPQFSQADEVRILELAVQTLTVLSVLFGLMFTPLGRRLRAEFT
jgi:hypothetical protein